MKQGEIYKLGNHILACGDSTDPPLVARAAGKIKVRMILTDPPYGVAYATKDNQAFKKITSDWPEISQDQLQTEDQYAAFTAAWLKAATPILEHYNTLYVFNSDSMICALRDGFRRAGFYYSQMIIWIKNTVIVGRKDYLPQHEIIAYAWYGRHKMERSKAKSVLFYPKPHRSTIHPTQKPPGLLRKIIPNGTKAGEYVYDPFGGSGSTLVACEHLGRRCLIIEQSEVYCASIIARWEKLTGKQAVKL